MYCITFILVHFFENITPWDLMPKYIQLKAINIKPKIITKIKNQTINLQMLCLSKDLYNYKLISNPRKKTQIYFLSKVDQELQVISNHPSNSPNILYYEMLFNIFLANPLTSSNSLLKLKAIINKKYLKYPKMENMILHKIHSHSQYNNLKISDILESIKK